MAGGTGKRKRGARAAARKARPQRPVRPVLGNDPFTMGAAPRAPATPAPEAATPAPRSLPIPTPTSTSTPTPTSTPTSAPTRADAQARLARLEQRLDGALKEAEDKLAALGLATGLAQGGQELREALTRLLPAVQARLGTILDLARLLEPPERLDRHGMDPRLAERAAPLAELLYSLWWRTTVRDIERVPADGPAIVVANHAGYVPWDALVLSHALHRDHPAHRSLRPLLDDREVDAPVIGPIAVRLGAVRASPEAAERLLAEGTVVGVFPEGSAGARKPWADRYRIQRFGRGGFVKLALRTGAPVVPCAIVGNEEASPGISRTGWLSERLGLPLLSSNPLLRLGAAAFLPLPSRWTLRFGEPIAAPGGPAVAEDLPAVHALTERVRSTLQAMLDEDLAARRSVFL